MKKPLAHDLATTVDAEGHDKGWQVVTSKRKARALSRPELASFQPALADTGITGLSLSSSAEENKPHGRQSSLASTSQSKNRLQDHLSRKNGSASLPQHANPLTMTPLRVSKSFQMLASPTTLGDMAPSFPFMKLPAELRNMVHRQALEPIFVGTHGNPVYYLDQDFPLLNLQLTSRQVYQEASEIVFRNGDFMIPAHFYRSIIPWVGKRFTDLLALKQLALYDFARDHPITNMTISSHGMPLPWRVRRRIFSKRI